VEKENDNKIGEKINPTILLFQPSERRKKKVPVIIDTLVKDKNVRLRERRIR
jgi:hypothetical protein